MGRSSGTGCRHNATGAVRIIDAPDQDCGQAETAISWNHQGPVGPQGPPGPRGQQGTAGPPGATVIDQIRTQFDGFNEQNEYSLFGTVELVDPGILRLMCRERRSADVAAASSRLLAIEVTTVG